MFGSYVKIFKKLFSKCKNLKHRIENNLTLYKRNSFENLYFQKKYLI